MLDHKPKFFLVSRKKFCIDEQDDEGRQMLGLHDYLDG
jgi:hypothetical protein